MRFIVRVIPPFINSAVCLLAGFLAAGNPFGQFAHSGAHVSDLPFQIVYARFDIADVRGDNPFALPILRTASPSFPQKRGKADKKTGHAGCHRTNRNKGGGIHRRIPPHSTALETREAAFAALAVKAKLHVFVSSAYFLLKVPPMAVPMAAKRLSRLLPVDKKFRSSVRT